MFWQRLICFFFLYFFGAFQVEVYSDDDIQDYYWRDYKGIIPHDALPGGNEKGRTTYIGQVLHKELLIPAKIIPSEKKAYYEWGFAEHSTVENIKIFCTNHPEKFEWVLTTSDDFKNITDKSFVVAGYEQTAILYIGRTYLEGDVVFGKLLVNDASVLHISKEGKGISIYIFEVLAYNENKTTEDRFAVGQPSICGKRPIVVNFFC